MDDTRQKAYDSIKTYLIINPNNAKEEKWGNYLG
jgi:hypothetical protein